MNPSYSAAPNILVVDDTRENLSLLVDLFEGKGYNVRPALNGFVALEAAKAAPPDLILLDINMPGMDGFEVCKLLKVDAELSYIPVIFISIRNSPEDIVRAFDVGGADYVSKPFNMREVIARVEYQLALQRQRRELEERYRRHAEHAASLDRMKEFVQTATHDLKNPLNLIWGYIHLLETMNGAEFEQDGKLFVEGIRAGADKMYRLITDILELMQLQTGANLCFEPMEMGGFVHQHLGALEVMALQKGLQFVYTPPAEPVYASVDQRGMERVIENLVTNAIKYTPAGTVGVQVDGDAQSVFLYVYDSGIGIPAEALPIIFDEFVRVNDDEHRRVDGTGLGLTIVKTAVERHGGSIEVQSEVGRGSMFTVRLPRLNS